MNLEAFGVKNLRCLTDTGFVPIRPVTVLVGRNSSGKSTFLRAFPLLRQSVETARDSPILWYREHNVDFGSLRDAANYRLSEPCVTFHFRLRLPKGAEIAIGDPPFDVSMTLAGEETPYVRAYDIRVEGHRIQWEFDARGQTGSPTVSGNLVWPTRSLSLGGKAHLLPTLYPGEVTSVSYQAAPEIFRFDPIDYQTRADDVLLEPLARALTKLFHGNTAPETINSIANDLPIGTWDAMRDNLSSLSNQKQFRQKVSELRADDFKDIVSSCLVRLSPYIIEATDQVLAHLFGRVSYLAPLRVSAERAYRIQNLAVEDVYPDGRNLAMFLRSLSTEEIESFASFTREALGFEAQVKTTGIYAEILVRTGKARRFVNLVDVGFGYSEVLPLAAVLWASCIRPHMKQREPAPLIAIEQPELHLHPAHQAKLARMIVDAMSKSHGARIIVETHSESLINGLGKLVYDGAIKAEDVQLVLFDQDEETEQTTVHLAGYRANGALHDWPYGFLSAVAPHRAPPAAAE